MNVLFPTIACIVLICANLIMLRLVMKWKTYGKAVNEILDNVLMQLKDLENEVDLFMLNNNKDGNINKTENK